MSLTMLATHCTTARGWRLRGPAPAATARPAARWVGAARLVCDQHPGHRAGAIRRARLRERLLDETGFTLIEMMVGLVATVTILSATFAMLESGQRVQARDAEWALALQEDRTGLARMVRDIRQATEIVEPSTGAASSYINFLATIGGTKYKVKYECSVAQSGTEYTECVRFAAEEGKTFPAKGARTAAYITNGSSVFSYSPPTKTEAKLVTAKLEIPPKGTLKQAGSSGYSKNKIVLEDAALMRNLCPTC